MLNGYYTDKRCLMESMEPIFKDLTGYKRIYFDHPGVGMTKGYENIKNWEEMLNVIIKFIQKVIPNERFLLVGRSFGGYMAQGILKKRRGLVDGLLLLCPLIELDRNKRDIDKDIKEINNTKKETDIRIKKEIIKSIENTDKDFMEKIRNKSTFDSRLNEKFKKPVTILTGRQDQVVGYRDAYNILDNYPRASYIVLDRGNHILHIFKTHIFNALVKEWINRVENESYI
ncbi:MAG: alpha/beta hydrolase [Firmicutes bacterium]|nr:alpha/beta hydrolase [Bacillota bacterium]